MTESLNQISNSNTVDSTFEHGSQIHAIFDAAPDAVVVIDANGIVIKWNAKSTQTFGWSASEVLGKPLHQFIIPDRYREAHVKGLERFMNTGQGPVINNTIEIKGLRRDGSEIDVELSISPTPVNGKMLFTGFIRDVTERKRADANIRFFNHLVNNASDAIIATDVNYRITSWNLGAEKIYGYKESEVIGAPSAEILKTEFPNDERKNVLSQISKSGIWKGEVTQLTKSGKRIPLLASSACVYDKNNQPIGYIAVNHDITEHKAAEKLLQTTQERFRLLVSSVKDYAIFMLEPDGRVSSWNAGAEKLKGYKADEIIGKHFSIFYPPEDKARTQQEIDVAIKEGRYEEEGWRIRKDGSRFWANVVLTAMFENGELKGFAKVTRDMTQRKRDEQYLNELNQAYQRSNEQLRSFAYVASHDLREPLRKIQVFADRLLDKEADNLSETGKDYFARMVNAAERMDILIEDLLAFSRTNAVNAFEPADLNEVIEAVKNDLSVQIADTSTHISYERLPNINGIPVQLRQLFQNLFSNAIKFRKPGVNPVITITNEIVEGSQLQFNEIVTNRSYLKISVSDNGIGFDSRHVEKIFELFQRLHNRHEYAGTGIGLAVCKRVAENHGGTITAESTLGEGSVFTVYLAT